MELWNPGVKAAADSEATIGIYDVIGDYWGEGMTATIVSSVLRRVGSDKPVTVFINSPGGEIFEGFAIYNLLRAHKGEVTVKVVGMAASAASIIAMAGDRVEVARSGFLMIHNSWNMVVGNRHDMRKAAEDSEQFDAAMVSIYEARTGIDASALADMLDNETWLAGKDAIAKGFADAFLPADELDQDSEGSERRAALNKIETILAKSGMPRSERRRLLGEIKDQVGTPRAAGKNVTPSAGEPGETEVLETSFLHVLSQR
jgi:ATP-dependent protease ClpP protease subunit